MSSTTRITGMYSGMDTDALIEEMLAANKTPLNNYEKEKIEVEWQRETLLDLNKQLLELQNLSENMKKDTSLKAYTTESTNSRIATATASSDALEGTYTILTEQLARATTLTSTPVSENPGLASISSNGRISYSTSLENTSFDITLDGQTKTITFGAGEGNFDRNTDIASVFQEKIDDAFGAGQIKVTVARGAMGYNISFDCGDNALNVPITVSATSSEKMDELGTTDALSKLKIDAGSTNIFDTTRTIADLLGTSESEITINVNGYSETISTQTTIADFFKKINNSCDDVSIKYDYLSDAIIMKRDSTGAGRNIELSDDLGLFDRLGLIKNESTYKEGQNAIVNITDPEGREKKVELTSNSFTYEGVNFNLTKAVPDEEVSITVAKDVDTVFNNIVEFVDKYNTILGKLNELYNEKPNKDYDPLLDEERDELSETQQEKWDKLAKQGILYRDSSLQSAISSMRSSVTSILSTNSDIKSLFQIGISTTSYSSTGNDNGKLVIDEEKLKEAINNNMDEVAALFSNKPEYITGTVLTESSKITAGSSFKITVNGKEETITFDKDYDLSDSSQRTEMISNLNTIFSNKFGANNVIATISSDRLVISSQKGNSIVMNSGTGNDALVALGVEDGATYDANALGFANKLYIIMERVQESITDKAGSSSTEVDESTLGQRLKRLNEYISRQEDRLEALEDRYYSQFAAMENALAQLESQSSYITSMLGGS